MVRDPFNEDHIEYKTVGEFVKDLEDHKRQLKAQRDQMDVNEAMTEALRADNRKLKAELEGLMAEMGDKLQGLNSELSRKARVQHASTDTYGLELKKPAQEATVAESGGEDYFVLKRRIGELEDELRRAKSQRAEAPNTSERAREASPPPPNADKLDQELKR